MCEVCLSFSQNLKNLWIVPFVREADTASQQLLDSNVNLHPFHDYHKMLYWILRASRWISRK